MAKKKVRSFRLPDGTRVMPRQKSKPAAPSNTPEPVRQERVDPAPAVRRKVRKKARPSRKRTSTNFAKVGQKIQAKARGFRLSFSDIGKTRGLSERQIATLLRDIDTDQNSLRISKSLYAKSELLKQKVKQKAAITVLYKAKTLHFPEKAVRIFPVSAETKEGQIKEVDEFVAMLRAEIDAYHEIGEQLAQDWPNVMEEARERLGDLFDPADYPTADQVRKTIRAKLEPYNFELPDYYKGVSPEAYREAVEELNRKFEQAAKRTESLLIDGLSTSLKQMHDRVRGFHAGEQKTFKSTAVTNVLKAVSEFRAQSDALGLMNSEELQEQFAKLEDLVTGKDAISADKLRTNNQLREDTLKQVEDILGTIGQFATVSTQRRNISV